MEQHLHLWKIEYEKHNDDLGGEVHLVLPYTTGPDSEGRSGTTFAWLTPDEARHFANDILEALHSKTTVVGTGLGSSKKRR
jgi:hypothetical protein